jgi:hypothetical protein
MITVQLKDLNQFRSAPKRSIAAIELQCTGRQPADEPAEAIATFQPLDPGIVNETIPAFFIGRNSEGFWVARDAGGRIGGIFLFENSALWFAQRHSAPSGCATIFPSDRIELDLENSGNPLLKPLARLMRLARRYRRWVAGAFLGTPAGRMGDQTPTENRAGPPGRTGPEGPLGPAASDPVRKPLI